MRILLINVPHPSIGSRIPDDHLPPLGLLSVGGPLIDDGHEVHLIDGEFGPMPTRVNFVFRDRRVKRGPTVAEFWGASQEKEEESMVATTRPKGRKAA